MRSTKTFLVFLLHMAIYFSSQAQKNLNFDFEKIDSATGFPEGLQFRQDQQKAYPLFVDSTIKQHGKYSVSLYQKDPAAYFGAVSFKIIPKFSGRKITLKGFIKTENVSGGYAGLWMRIDGDGGVLKFDNMSKGGITGTSDWKEYSISLDFNEEDAEFIYVGGILEGKGKMWLDNLQLFIDDKDISLAPAGKKIVQKAKLDTAFSQGSGIQIGALNSEKIDYLMNLGMVWGFLKYYHPAIGNGDYNWDAELFRVLPKVLDASSKAAFNDILEKWIDALGKVESCKDCSSLKIDSAIKLKPDYGNIFQKNNLSESVVSKLDNVKNNRHLGKGYYIDKAPGAGNPVFKHENAYSKMLFPDAGYRLLALFRYWNMIQYFYPYKHLIGEDWNKVLPEFIPKFIESKDTIQYVLACLELIARVHDTHANVWGSNNALDEYRGKFHAPMQTTFIAGDLVVTGYYTDTLGIRDKIKTGDVITQIDGQEVKTLIKNNLSFSPASNFETQLRDLPGRTLMRSRKDSMLLQILRGGRKIDIETKLFTSDHLNLMLDYDPHPNDSSYKIINGNIGYVFPGRYKNSQLDEIEKAFKNTAGMIIDMRCYPSEFMPFTFGSYIKSMSTPFVKFTDVSLDMPGLFTFGPLLNNGTKNLSSYSRPVVIIVNATTQSQAEYTTMAFQSASVTTVIGSTTAGADGNVSQISLPGGVSTMISGIGVYYPDGTETQRKGVRIDKGVYPTLQGIKEGRDELLKEALEIIKSKTR